MARALIVGCGCRGRELGRALMGDGWQVRGTTRSPAQAAAIEAAGIEAAIADPDRIGTLVDHVAEVAVVFWLLGSATGEEEAVRRFTGRGWRGCSRRSSTRRCAASSTRLRDAGSRDDGGAMQALRDAGERWRIPFEVVDASAATSSCGARGCGPRPPSWSAA